MRTKKNNRIIPVHADIRERHRQRQLKKRRVRFALFCTGIALLVLLIGLALVFLTPWFHINNVTVAGNTKTKTADIVASSGIVKGKNVFSVRMDTVEQALLKVPYVKAVEAKRKLPNTIELHITESHMVARIEKGSLQICIDETGEVVEASANPSAEVMQVIGLQTGDYVLGEPLKVTDNKKLQVLLNFISVTEECGVSAGIRSVDISDTSRITFAYGQGLNVICGDTYDLKQKILTFKEAVSNLPANAEGEFELRIPGEARYNS